MASSQSKNVKTTRMTMHMFSSVDEIGEIDL